MTEEDVFLRDIIDSRGDPLPRSVNADWLDDRGDPRGARVWDKLHMDAKRLGNREVVDLPRAHSTAAGG
jgi:uncharacterized protein (TIGR02996 family)